MWGFLLSWMPLSLSILCQLFLAIIVIYIVLRLIAIVLSAIPFL